MTMRQLLGSKFFWIFIVLMVCAGSSEIAMSQWASAFAESALRWGIWQDLVALLYVWVLVECYMENLVRRLICLFL